MKWKPTHWLYIVSHVVVFLIGVLLTTLGGTLWTSVGASLIAAGAAGWILFLYVWISDQTAESIRLLTDFGFKNAYGERGPNIKDVYENRIENASDSIDIVGFGLRTFRQDSVPHKASPISYF